MFDPFEIKKVEKKSIGQSSGEKTGDEKSFEENMFQPSDYTRTSHEKSLEENMFQPSHYSHLGCPTVPIAFAGD